MKTSRLLVSLVAAAAALPAVYAVETQRNPLRKIVTLLQDMSKEVEVEGDRAKELFEKFMCYCSTNSAQLSKGIDVATAHVDELNSGVEELSGSNAQLSQELKDLKEDVADNSKAISEAEAQRTTEAASYAAESTEASNSIGALDKAIPALKAGLASPAAVLAQLGSMGALARAAPTAEQASLLQSGSSDEILGILEQMRDDFKANLAQSTQQEQEAISTFGELSGAKKKQIQAATTEINEKEGRLALQKQQVADFTEDLEDTSGKLAADQDFLGGLKKACAAKTTENEEQNKSRNAELVAISDCVKILNDDDAQEMFKKTLPSFTQVPATSFLQSRLVKHRGQKDNAVLRRRMHAAALALRSTPSGLHKNALSFLAVRMERMRQPGQGFGPLKGSVQQMLSDMQAEQADDDAHLESCKGNLRSSNQEKKGLEDAIASEASKIEALEMEVKKLVDEIKVLKSEVAELDVALTEATAQRKKEKGEFTKTMSELSISSNLLMKAKAVLERQYAAKKPDGEASFMQQSSSSDSWAASLLGASQAPATAGYEKKGGAGMGVVSLLTELCGDIKAQQQAAEMTENNAQKDFDELSQKTKDSSDATQKDIVGKESEKSVLEETMLDVEGEKSQTEDENTAVVNKIQALHSSCDFLIANFEERKKARGDEVASLTNCLAILSGADFGPPPAAEQA